ncbi:MAG: DNA (cytosine-5-)-methyltransferase [Clostridia bacterium]|nr:DNA (cytosine-5-)-methyltransferase [Clostridia bacterium]
MRVGSLFSGIGGIDLGFKQSGFDIVWANEIDKEACKTYRLNFPETTLFENDIRTIDATLLPKVDVITAGFPCQSFSVCGNQKGFNDSRGNLFFEIMRIVDVIQPSIIFLENVANLVKHDEGRTFNVIHNELVCRDYYLRYLVADACDYGIPQHRTRTYLIAFQSFNQCESYRFPEKIKLKKRIFDLIDKSIKADKCFYLSENTPQYNKMIKAIKDNNQIYRFSDYGIQSGKDEISFTLKANMGTWNDRVPIIKDNYRIRTITPNECLALMGFPKNFKIADIPLKSAYKQIGNSVCVPIIKMIAKEINKINL